ncbi:PREDICTED: putative F-box protein At4g10190 [Camelina sativa]|uniref:F-box protein At4g10190 n=1 Tax=Camelina sativa TaxID=90675 RepID=A0ABM1RBR7_CAMSA|nr:PREDICTED: putative F-box protein At4g10190 [Camelina sativa]
MGGCTNSDSGPSDPSDTMVPSVNPGQDPYCQLDRSWKASDPNSGGVACQSFETDCADLIAMTQAPKDWHAFSNLLDNFLLLRGIFPHFSLPKISRSSNLRADCLVRWKALIKDVRLAETHSHATVIMLIGFRVYLASVNLHESYRNMVLVTDQFRLKDPFSKSSEEVKIRDIFHCDGLLLCTTRDIRLVVWNPYSRETRWILQPRSSYRTSDYFALGKTSCNKYKILRMQQFGEGIPYLLKSEIYDFTSSSWRFVGKTRDCFILPWKGRVMSVNGNTYWLAYSKHNVDFLQSFDYSTESFRSASLPEDHHSYQVCSLSVTREEQQLCFLTKVERRINVRIATRIESNGSASWIKLACIHQPFFVCNAMDFLVDKENQVVVCRGKNGVSNKFLHILGENKSIQVHHHDDKSECSLLVNYVPSLVQIQ